MDSRTMSGGLYSRTTLVLASSRSLHLGRSPRLPLFLSSLSLWLLLSTASFHPRRCLTYLSKCPILWHQILHQILWQCNGKYNSSWYGFWMFLFLTQTLMDDYNFLDNFCTWCRLICCLCLLLYCRIEQQFHYRSVSFLCHYRV